MKRKNSLSPLSTMLKMGLLCVGVLVALALTSPSPPLSDAASRQEMAASETARAQLEQLKREMLEGHSSTPLPDVGENGESSLAGQAPEPLSAEQEAELKRIRDRLALSEEPLNLVEEPQDNTLDDPTLAELAELQTQAEQQARSVEPFINQELDDKRAQLAAEEARLRLERQSMEQLKEDIDRRLAELKQLQQAVEDIATLQEKAQTARSETTMTDEQRQAKILQVSKVISQMKPAAAAQVLEKLAGANSLFTVEVVSKISPRIAGKIMNVMDPVIAANISALMAREEQVAQARQTEEELDQQIQAAMQNAGQAAQNAAANNPAAPRTSAPETARQPQQ